MMSLPVPELQLHVGHNSAYIAYNGQEVPVREYEVLAAPVASLSWIDGQGGQIPPHAVPGGNATAILTFAF